MHAQALGDAFEALGGSQLKLLALDHTGSGDEEEGLVESDLASKQLHGRYLG
jgi:hypothetical protein